MNPESSTYVPIACDYHEILLHYATLGQEVPITYEKTGAVSHIRARIADVYTYQGAEFLLTSSGERIRLDLIMEVDGQLSSGFRGCRV